MSIFIGVWARVVVTDENAQMFAQKLYAPEVL